MFCFWLSASSYALPGAPTVTSSSGALAVRPSALTVETKDTMEVEYTIGSDGFALGDELIIDDPIFHGIRWSKWGELSPYYDDCTPHSNDSDTPSVGLVAAYATRDTIVLPEVRLTATRSNCGTKAGTCTDDIHASASTVVYLESGELEEGDVIRVVYGAISRCVVQCTEDGNEDCSSCEECGFEPPDRSFASIWLYGEECLDSTCTELDPVSLSVQHTKLRELVMLAPSQVVAGQAFSVKFSLLDLKGNPVDTLPLTLSLSLDGAVGSGDGDTYTLDPITDGGWHDFSVTLMEPGVYRLTGSAGPLTATSNPIEVTQTAPEYSIYWGDIHVHHGYTFLDSDGTRRDYNHDYGRDVAGLDVVSESMKAGSIEIGAEDLWAELQDSCTQYTTPGDYLVLLGFEWVGDNAANAKCGNGTCSDGHHNIYYDSCDGPLAPEAPDEVDGLAGESGLWAWLDITRASYNLDAVSIPHAMRWTHYNFDNHYLTDAEPGYPGTQTLVEIFSEWGDGTEVPRSGGSVQDMMASGHRVGWIGGSDNHDGWMGNIAVKKTGHSTGGLAAFLAPSLTRSAIFTAMQTRHTYATSGHRPIVHFSISDSGATIEQGQEYLPSSPTVSWRYYGTDTLLRLSINWLPIDDLIEQSTLYTIADALDDIGQLDLRTAKDGWDGESEGLVWLEAVQIDGQKAWSSPIWLTGDCTRLTLGAIDPLNLCGSADTADTGLSSDTASPTAQPPDRQLPAADTASTDDPSPSISPEPQVRCASTAATSAAAFLFMTSLVGLRRRDQ